MSDGHGPAFTPRRFVLAEFATADALLAGTQQMREKGHKKLDTHTPYPIHGLEKALGLGRPKIPTLVLLGALVGAFSAFAMMVYMNVIDFPINVANRPPLSAPAFVPITFELAVLLGGSTSFLGLMALMRLPEPYHPLFEAPSFSRASIDAFFLSVEMNHDKQPEDVMADARQFGALGVELVEESER